MRVVLSMPQPEESPMHAAGRAAYYILLAVGIAALGYASYSVLDGYWYQHVEMRRFDASLAENSAHSPETQHDIWRDAPIAASATGASTKAAYAGIGSADRASDSPGDASAAAHAANFSDAPLNTSTANASDGMTQSSHAASLEAAASQVAHSAAPHVAATYGAAALRSSGSRGAMLGTTSPDAARDALKVAPASASASIVRAAIQPIPNGTVLGEIEVPRLELKAIVVEGDSSQQLRCAVGHLPDTALPGEPGNVALAAHRDSLFRPLREIQSGDTIVLHTREREIEYRVEWFAIVEPAAVEFLQPTAEPSLTLVTCYPFSYLGSAPKRFIVRAVQTSPEP